MQEEPKQRSIVIDKIEDKLSVKTEDGQELFTVSDTFSEVQIGEVLSLCERYLSQGVSLGVQSIRNDLKKVLGLTPPKPAPTEDS